MKTFLTIVYFELCAHIWKIRFPHTFGHISSTSEDRNEIQGLYIIFVI